jgi:MFS family permease
VTTSVVQVGVLRGAAWVARGLRVPARNALLADVVPAGAYGRAYGFERTMDNLGAIGGPLLALALVSLVGVRTAILLSVIPRFDPDLLPERLVSVHWMMRASVRN